MTKDEILKKKPNVDDFDLQPYGYINALINYINKLEVAINNTLCCTELNDKKAMTFEEYIDSFYERKDFKYVNKRGQSFKSTEITQIYDEHIHNL